MFLLRLIDTDTIAPIHLMQLHAVPLRGDGIVVLDVLWRVTDIHYVFRHGECTHVDLLVVRDHQPRLAVA
jgi:hypothetical protein